MKQLLNVFSCLLVVLLFSFTIQAQYAAVKFVTNPDELKGYTSDAGFTTSNGINSISASLSNRKINLAWSIPANLEASTFIIERSLDGEVFEVVGSDATAASNAGKKNFSFTDKPGNKSLANQDIYYRLGTVSADNEYSYTKPLLVRVNGKGNLDFITVFPHPKGNDINMILGLKEDSYFTAILKHDNGQQVLTQKGKLKAGTQQLALVGTSQIEAGNYWLEVMVDSKPALYLKLIKE